MKKPGLLEIDTLITLLPFCPSEGLPAVAIRDSIDVRRVYRFFIESTRGSPGSLLFNYYNKNYLTTYK